MKLDVIEECPDFEPRDKRGIWIYRLDREFRMPSSFTGSAFVAEWLRIDADGTITIPEGYAWDGATPKFSLLDLLILGVPDGIVSVRTGKPRTHHATLVHDALYQYFPWHDVTRKEIDVLFLEMMRQERFKLSWVYYTAVRLLGGFFVPGKSPGRADIEFDAAAPG